MRRLLDRATQLLSGVAGWLMLAMVVLLVAEIASRSVNRPLQLMAELSVFVMLIVVYLGFARCERDDEHVRLEIVVSRLPARWRAFLAVISQSLALAVIGLLFYAVASNAWFAFRTNSSIEGIVNLPLWPTMFVMVVGMLFFTLQSLMNLVRALGQLRAARGRERG